jgi:hypothetical protein
MRKHLADGQILTNGDFKTGALNHSATLPNR